MKTKSYFKHEDSEIAYDKSYFLQEMKDEDLTEMTVLEALPTKEFDSEFIWCMAVDAVGDKSECNKSCDLYKPKNGKNGRCEDRGRFMEYGKEVILKLKRI